MTQYLSTFLPLCLINLVADYAKSFIIIFHEEGIMLFDGHQLLPFELHDHKKVIIRKAVLLTSLFGHKLKIFSFPENKWNELYSVNTLFFKNQWETYSYVLTPSYLYVSGLDPVLKQTNLMCKFDVVNFVHTQLTLMNSRRTFESITVIGDRIYVIGNTDTNEYYDGDKWINFNPLNHPRRKHKSIVHDGKIYVFGGFNSEGNHKLPVERYDPHIDEWATLSMIPSFKKQFEVISFENKMYVIGGVCRRYDPINKKLIFEASSVIDIYDPEVNTWTKFDTHQTFSDLHVDLY